MLPGYLIKTVSLGNVYEMLRAKLEISYLREVCIFGISFCQPSLTLHRCFLLNHPTTWLVLTMPYNVHNLVYVV